MQLFPTHKKFIKIRNYLIKIIILIKKLIIIFFRLCIVNKNFQVNKLFLIYQLNTFNDMCFPEIFLEK